MKTKVKLSVELLLDVHKLIEAPYDRFVIFDAQNAGHTLSLTDMPCPKYFIAEETAEDYPCLVRKFIKENNITLGDKIKVTLEKVGN